MLPIEEAAAVEQFILSCTIPIFYDRGDKCVPHATGTLLQIDERYFVVTAAHILEKLAPENLAFAMGSENSSLFTFGKMTISKPEKKVVNEFDVAIFELLEEEPIAHLRNGWRFITPDQVGSPRDDGQYVLSGYPTEKAGRDGNLITNTMVSVCTERVIVTPSGFKDVVDGLDLFFRYDDSVRTLDGQTMERPDLPGTSGASIWRYQESDEPVWRPEDSLKIVGVQSSYIRNKAMRVKNWNAVAHLLVKFDESLAVALRNAL